MAPAPEQQWDPERERRRRVRARATGGLPPGTNPRARQAGLCRRPRMHFCARLLRQGWEYGIFATLRPSGINPGSPIWSFAILVVTEPWTASLIEIAWSNEREPPRVIWFPPASLYLLLNCNSVHSNERAADEQARDAVPGGGCGDCGRRFRLPVGVAVVRLGRRAGEAQQVSQSLHDFFRDTMSGVAREGRIESPCLDDRCY